MADKDEKKKVEKKVEQTDENGRTLTEAVKQDLKGTPEGQLSPVNFVKVTGDTNEDGRAEALRNAGDGTQAVWPPQPVPDRKDPATTKE